MKCEFDRRGTDGIVYCPQTDQELPEKWATKYAKAYLRGGIENAKRFLTNQTKRTSHHAS